MTCVTDILSFAPCYPHSTHMCIPGTPFWKASHLCWHRDSSYYVFRIACTLVYVFRIAFRTQNLVEGGIWIVFQAVDSIESNTFQVAAFFISLLRRSQDIPKESQSNQYAPDPQNPAALSAVWFSLPEDILFSVQVSSVTRQGPLSHRFSLPMRSCIRLSHLPLFSFSLSPV